jgi:UDP-N-acetylmuramoylalanine--D-glutamate ligase
MRVAILGFGIEGQAMLRALKRDPLYHSAEITVLDQNKKTKVPKGVRAILGSSYLNNLKKFDIIFRTPGFAYLNPKLQAARREGVEISSATRYFFENAPSYIIGITGTKGKGTTSTLLYEILKKAGRRVYLAGNIGTPAVALLSKTKRRNIKPLDPQDIVILELSSFQLQDLNRSPHIAVILDIFPDHQDAHRNMQEYVKAKSQITRHQTTKDMAFFFSDNSWSRWVASFGKGKKVAVNPNKTKIISASELAIPGNHNFRNAVMAAEVASALKVPRSIIQKTIRSFRGLEHRLEFVRQIGKVRFYNDSASTNPHTAAAACRAFKIPTILIAGGKDKNLNYRPLANAIYNSSVMHIVLCGENSKKIKKALLGVQIPVTITETLKDAVGVAYRVAQSYKKEVAVVFSPGAASFDMFKNYKERGKYFKKVVTKLPSI